MSLRSKFAGTGYDVSRWLVLLFLALGVIAPAACVLWFMNEAMTNQRDAAREKLAEAYRGQLQLMRDRLDADWEKRSAEVERDAESMAAPLAFEKAVKDGLADAVIVLRADGPVGYPGELTDDKNRSSDPLVGGETGAEWTAARSMESQGFYSGAAEAYARIGGERGMQASIRCLARGGQKAQAVRAIVGNFSGGRDGIAADELLLALKLMDRGDGRYGGVERQVRELTADYAAPIASSQRLFLMDELGGEFPTHAAERLAAQYLESQRAHAGSGVLEPSGVADVWKLGAAGGRAVALYRTATVLADMRKVTGGAVAFDVAPPSEKTSSEWTNISGRLAGWRIADPSAIGTGVGAEPAMSRYVWMALAAIGVVALAAVVAGQSLRRQWRLARLKTDLVAAVSHELRTPLASVRLLVETLLEDERPEGKTREYLEMIARENLRLSRLIGNFLTFSRLERNLRKFDIRSTAPERVVEAVVESASERLTAPDCRFEVEVTPGLPAVRADEDALVTVLLNLLDNAYKYSPGEKQIVLRAIEEDGHVVFAVKDAGIGIAAREQKRIFRRFYQVDRRLAREAGGVGLGLSIVEFIVRAHGGRVRVESEIGKGSTFSVVMP